MPHLLNLRAEIDSAQATERLDRLRTADVPRDRQQLTRVVMREVLRRTIVRHPVDTGRSRSAWSTALTQLGGTPPAGPQGDSPAAIAEGAALASVGGTSDEDTTELTVTNAVEYVPCLEFGTRSQPPRHMVGRSLAETKANLRQIASGL